MQNEPEHKLVVTWIEIHKDDLKADWELAVNGTTLFFPIYTGAQIMSDR